MSGLLAYGSLMHPDEIANHCAAVRSVAVRVRGYRRSFSQEPAWRAGAGRERGVLTVRPAARDWFNAILIVLPDAGALAALDHRERGYKRVSVPASTIEPYAGDAAADMPAGAALYTGRDEMRNDSLLPNSAYLSLCVEAAARWGEAFERDFMSSTYVRDVTLEQLLRDASQYHDRTRDRDRDEG